MRSALGIAGSVVLLLAMSGARAPAISPVAAVPVVVLDSSGCGPAAGAVARRPAGTLLPARRQASAVRVVVNLPAYRLDVIEDGVIAASYRISPGKRRYPTPRGVFSVEHAEWNPWWIPPPGEWAKDDTVTPPGSRNPMGRVKLGFAPYYYVHGTPFESSLGTPASHGCVRLANADAIALARRLHRHATSDATIDSLIADSTRTVRVDLAAPVPLEIRYDVVEVAGDSIRIHPDIYRLVGGGYRALATSALHAAGHDTSGIDARRLAAAVRRGQRRTITVAVRQLRPDTVGSRGNPHESSGRLGL